MNIIEILSLFTLGIILVNYTTETRMMRPRTIPTSEYIPPTKNSVCGTGCPGCNVNYLGGKVMHGSINLYHIFVGKSATDYVPESGLKTGNNNFVNLMSTFASEYSSSSHASVLKTYSDRIGPASTAFKFIGNSFYQLPSSQKRLTDASIATILKAVVKNEGWPAFDSNGIYTIFFRGDLRYSSEITGSSWGDSWCGFHDSTFPGLDGANVVVIGDTNFNPSYSSGCAFTFFDCASITGYFPNAQSPYCVSRNTTTCGTFRNCFFVSPNNNIGADGAISTYAHEIMETITDTSGAYWVNDSKAACIGYENADLCTVSYSNLQYSDGTHWNIILNSTKFLIQDTWQWSPAGGQCVNSFIQSVTSSMQPIKLPTVGPSVTLPYSVQANGFSTSLSVGGIAGVSIAVFVFCCCVVYSGSRVVKPATVAPAR